MRRSVLVLCPLAWLLGCAVVGSEAGTKWQKHEEKKPEKLECYVCNSLYDARCADPFDPYTLGYIDCNLKDPPEHLNQTLKPFLCRKTVQKVQGKLRVIRGCGYYPDTKYDSSCVRRTGTFEVIVTYCACNTSFCNTGYPNTHPSISLAIGALAAPALYYVHLGYLLNQN